MAERRNAYLFEVLISQIRQDDEANVILGKSLSVLPETKLPSQSATCCIRGRPTDLPVIRSGPAESLAQLGARSRRKTAYGRGLLAKSQVREAAVSARRTPISESGMRLPEINK